MQQQPQQLLIAPFDLESYISRYDSHSEVYLQRLLHIGHYFHFAGERGGDGGDDADKDGVGRDDGDDHHRGWNNIAKQACELAVARMKESGNYHRYLEEYGAVIATAADAATLSSPTEPKMTSSSSKFSSPLPSSQRKHCHDDDDDDDDATDAHNTARHHPPHSQQQQQHAHAIIQQYLPNTYDPHFVASAKQMAFAKLEILEGRLAIAQSKLMKESIRTGLLALAVFHRDIGELREASRRVLRSR